MRIRVTETVRVLALIRVVPRGRICLGSSLDMEALRDEWACNSGLRQRDLEMLLAAMARRRELVRLDNAKQNYALTVNGVDYLLGGYRRSASLFELVRAKLLLSRTQRRGLAPTPRTAPRRVVDRIASMS